VAIVVRLVCGVDPVGRGEQHAGVHQESQRPNPSASTSSASAAVRPGVDSPIQKRVLVMRNSRDFAPLAREWAEAQRTHSGVVLIWTLNHSQFGETVAGVERLTGQWPTPEHWRDLVVAL
jgi:hypothetical protein